MSKTKKRTRGNIRQYRGKTLHSDLELSVFKQLYRDRRTLKRTFSFEYESEKLTYTIEGEYTPDFIIEIPDQDKKIYVECKGYLDYNSKRKMLAIRRNYPDLDIRFLFSKNNKIKNSKLRYVDWALRNNFNDAAVGDVIPVEWLVGDYVTNKEKESEK